MANRESEIAQHASRLERVAPSNWFEGASKARTTKTPSNEFEGATPGVDSRFLFRRLKRHDIANRQSAFTLVELLVAVSIVAILLMAGVGLYWRMSRGFAVRAATSAIESALRSARAFAIHERGPATVVPELQPDNAGLVGLVYALGKQTVSSWHFERGRLGEGALGQQGTPVGTPTSAEGRIGGAMQCGTSADRIGMQVTSPYLDGVRDGLFVEAYVYPEPTAAGTLPVVCKSQGGTVSYRLALSYDGTNAYLGLEGEVRIDNTGPVPLSAPDTATPVAPAIRIGEWSHVAMSYYPDRVEDQAGRFGVLILRVNGAEVARRQTPLASGSAGRLTQVAGSLWMGTDGTNHFAGRLDEVKIAGLVAGETYVLPKNAEVTVDFVGGSTDGRVHFDSEGKLDPRAHTGDVFFTIRSPSDDLKRFVRVNALGTVEVFDNRPQQDR